MRKNLKLTLAGLALTIALLACDIPGGYQIVAPAAPPQQQPDIQLAVEQTLTAIALQNPSETPSPSPIPTLTEMPTLEILPTGSPTATASPIPLFSVTPSTIFVSVSVATNCRSGPGKVYDYRGALLVGETTEVVGWEGSGEYWYVRNPDKAGDFCWVWGKYATLTGSPAGLPALTPPPTPTPAPDFSIVSVRVDSCVGWFISVKVKNTGTITFDSIRVNVEDTNTKKTVGSPVYDGFEEWKGCIGSAPINTLASGKTGYVQSNDFNYDPSGNNLKITVTLCSEDGGGGMCVSRSKTVKP